MLDSVPTKRPTSDKLFKSAPFKKLFKNPVNETLEFLEEFQFKTDAEKPPFIQGLTCQIQKFPKSIACYKILPFLCSILTSPVPSQSGQKPIVNPLAPIILNPMLQIGKMLDDSTEYQVRIVPAIILMFSSADRNLRAALLKSIPDVAPHLDAKVVNAQIFPCIVTGFSDSAPALREMTIKSVLPLAPLLDEKNLNEVLLRHVVTLLKDKEAAIRTNTLICIAKIIDRFSDKSKHKIIIGTFLVALRDPFVPARVAAVKGVGFATKYLASDHNTLGHKVLPALSGSLLDPSPEVRNAAFQHVNAIVALLQTWSDKRAIEQKKEAEELRNKQKTEAVSELPSPSPAAGGYLSGWAPSMGSLGWGSAAPNAEPSISQPNPKTRPNPLSQPNPMPHVVKTEPLSTGLSLKAENLSDSLVDAWGEDDEDLFGSSKPNKVSTKNETKKIPTQENTELFFNDLTSNKLGLKTATTATRTEDRKVEAEKKREEARQRIKQRKDARKQNKPVFKKSDENTGDGWDDF